MFIGKFTKNAKLPIFCPIHEIDIKIGDCITCAQNHRVTKFSYSNKDDDFRCLATVEMIKWKR